MDVNSFSMAYLKDSKIVDEKLGTTLSIDTIYFNSDVMYPNTQVIRQKGWFIPLVFVYIWNSQNNCIQGKSMIEEDIPTFLHSSLTEEINRSGIFLVDTLKNPTYQLELSIDKVDTQGPYRSSGFFYMLLYVYGYSYSDNAGPAVSKVSVSYKLKKDGEVVLRNAFDSEKTTQPINKHYSNTSMLQRDYAVSMVEATSYNFKDVIELIVNDLNQYFSNQD
jgi:hypothetical protein